MNKTVFITGSSSGMGKETAKLFAAKGWNVIASMRSPEKEEELNQLKNVLVTRLDVQDIDSIHTALRQGIEHFGKIDVLVNNAGYGLVGVFESLSREQIIKHFEVNLFGLMEVTKAILPHFRENNSGTIVNISSMGGRVTFPILSLYHASKFAVEGFSESLSYELLANNIQVKIVEPGSVKTNFSTVAEFALNTIPAYDKVISDFMSKYPQITEHTTKASAVNVADIVYQAATDVSPRLRYLAGGDAEFYVASRENSKEEDYIHQMRNHFINE